MTEFTRLATAVAGVAMLMATALVIGGGSDRSEATALPPFFESAMGTTVVDGVSLRVHVVAAVHEGQDGRALAEQAVRNLGATPLRRAEWGSLVDTDGVDDGSGGVWWESLNGGNDTIVLEYSTPSEALSGAKNEVMAAAASWTGVSSSRLEFSFDADVTTCPSLVLECGSQGADGKNSFGWALLGPGVLGVTWMVADGQGRTPQEADIALSTRYNWTTGGGPFAINLQTVALHELGHVLGLDHSRVRRATMYASYTKADTSLHGDDVDGLSTLYPSDGGPTDPPVDSTPEPTNPWCSNHDLGHPAYAKKCG